MHAPHGLCCLQACGISRVFMAFICSRYHMMHSIKNSYVNNSVFGASVCAMHADLHCQPSCGVSRTCYGQNSCADNPAPFVMYIHSMNRLCQKPQDQSGKVRHMQAGQPTHATATHSLGLACISSPSKSTLVVNISMPCADQACLPGLKMAQACAACLHGD